MNKQIVIIGGGISGLTLLHYLNQKYAKDGHVEICLFEKNPQLGGTIQSIEKEGVLFETGPNGFLDSKPQTLKLVKELGLDSQLIKANTEAKRRFISLNNQLYQLPASPKEFLTTSLLNPLDKLRVLSEFLIPKGGRADESVFGFGKRRFGSKFAQHFLDPMVSGIYGGDANELNLKAAFPRIHELEMQYGSLFKAMFKLKSAKKSSATGMPKGTLTSFHSGMQQLIKMLGETYADQIHTNKAIRSVSHHADKYIIYTPDERYEADALYVSTPAYHAADLLHTLSESLSNYLKNIVYAPMAVIGLVFNKSDLKRVPQGFGYLIPSKEQKEVLGVLFDHNIFNNRCAQDQVLLRVMIGGARWPNILDQSEDELKALALKEIDLQFGANKKPVQEFCITYKKAIPQYDQTYVKVKRKIEEELQKWNHLELVANYWQGVSLNDCVESAYKCAQNSSLN